MSLISLGENKWQMTRRVLKAKRFTFTQARNGTRLDRAGFDWLVANGFFVAVGEDKYEVTAKGRAAAGLGFYEV
jgi:hypothetical protein